MQFEDLALQRQRTETVSSHLLGRLRGHLETIKPLLLPQRILGRFADGKVEVAGADRVLAQIQERYRELPLQPYSLPREFDVQWLNAVGHELRLYPWEYSYSLPAAGGAKSITMTSPLCWLLTFASGYTLSQFRNALAGRETRRPDYVRQFILNHLVMQALFAAQPGLASLLTDLRFDSKPVSSEEFPKLPLLTLQAGLGSFRPEDALIQAAVAFSGVPAFIELAKLDDLPSFPDPLRDQITACLQARG